MAIDQISQKYRKKTEDILKTMPDSPSMSNRESNTNKEIPLILASEATTKSRRKDKKNKNKGTRESMENIVYNDDEFELKDIEDELVRYNDPPPKHASKKYDGFVPKAINRMDTTGKLPTPSRSENQSNLSFSYEIEQQERKSADQHNYAISQLKQFQKEYQQETYSRNTQKPIGLPPRPPPPSRQEDGGNDNDNDIDYDDEYYDDIEDDDDLKQNNKGLTILSGLPPPLYADDGLQRDRGFTNESNISGSQSMSDVGSLNSADSSELSSLDNKIKTKTKKKQIIETNYNPNQPLISVSSSQTASQTTSTTETDSDIKE